MMHHWKRTAAVVVVGLMVPSATRAGGLTSDILFGGDWSGTYQAIAPNIALDHSGIDPDYQGYTGSSSLPAYAMYVRFSPSAQFDFTVETSAYADFRYIDTADDQVAGQINGNTLTWSKVTKSLLTLETDAPKIDTIRNDYTLSFSEDAAGGLWHLDGGMAPTFLLDALPPEVNFNRIVVSNAELHLSRSFTPPVAAVPLPGALPTGLILLGGLGTIGLLRRRKLDRRIIAE